MFSFEPLTEEQIQMSGLMEPGVYQFKVFAATPKISSNGNQMIELKLLVWDHDGKERVIFDYLVSTKNMMFKVKHFCDSIGLQAQYQQGRFSEIECIDKTGNVSIDVRKGTPKPDGNGNFPDKNIVKDYVKREVSKIASHAIKKEDDDLPF